MAEVGDNVLRVNGRPIAAMSRPEFDAHSAVIAAMQRKRALGTDCHVTREIDRAERTGATSKIAAVARRLRSLGE